MALTSAVTSFYFTLGLFLPEKNLNGVKSNYNFHLKLQGDRALILPDLDSAMDKYFPHIG